MYKFHLLHINEDIDQFCNLPGFPTLDPTTVLSANADAYWVVTDTCNHPLGRCALSWNESATEDALQSGSINYFAAATPAVAEELRTLAEDHLCAKGCESIVDTDTHSTPVS